MRTQTITVEGENGTSLTLSFHDSRLFCSSGDCLTLAFQFRNDSDEDVFFVQTFDPFASEFKQPHNTLLIDLTKKPSDIEPHDPEDFPDLLAVKAGKTYCDELTIKVEVPNIYQPETFLLFLSVGYVTAGRLVNIQRLSESDEKTFEFMRFQKTIKSGPIEVMLTP